MAVRWITEREKGGILLPNEVDTKTGEYAINMLKAKHPDPRFQMRPTWKITKRHPTS
jgi:hypothetical protein